MGRKRKFGEESDFVTVRVPKSKRDEYRRAIQEFVEKMFKNERSSEKDESSSKFRDFREFIERFEKTEKDE